jgi:hypothetical protein
MEKEKEKRGKKMINITKVVSRNFIMGLKKLYLLIKKRFRE